MCELTIALKTLKWPRLLTAAARHGLGPYRRERHLTRILRQDRLPAPRKALTKLLDLETEMNTRRQQAQNDYCIADHVAVLTALMAEARLLQSAPPNVVQRLEPA